MSEILNTLRAQLETRKAELYSEIRDIDDALARLPGETRPEKLTIRDAVLEAIKQPGDLESLQKRVRAMVRGAKPSTIKTTAYKLRKEGRARNDQGQWATA